MNRTAVLIMLSAVTIGLLTTDAFAYQHPTVRLWLPWWGLVADIGYVGVCLAMYFLCAVIGRKRPRGHLP